MFLNTNVGFDDVEEFRNYYYQQEIVNNIDQNQRNCNVKEHIFDEMLHKCRFVIERTNARLDAFKAILIRFETNALHWKALNLMAMCVIILLQL